MVCSIYGSLPLSREKWLESHIINKKSTQLVNSTQLPMLDLLESICKFMHFFLKFCIIQWVYLSITSCLNIHLHKFKVIVGGNYQRDLRLYIGSFDEISPFWIYFSFFVWRNPNVISEDLWHLKFLLCVWAVSIWIWISACAMSFVLQFHFMKYEKYIRSCDLACLRQYHKWIEHQSIYL